MNQNYDKLKKEVSDGLTNNANILIQSKYGDENNDLVLDAVEKAGLRLFSMELGDPSKVRKGAWNNATTEEKEKRIRSFVKDEKATALLVDMHPARVNEVGSFVNVAKDLGIPLIVSLTNDVELKADVFPTTELLVNAVNGSNSPQIKSKETVSKIIQDLHKDLSRDNPKPGSKKSI
jgi:hypothetical protein